ncbi:MAG: hypothetical protein AAF664_05960 [Planctomycetota bacterium]
MNQNTDANGAAMSSPKRLIIAFAWLIGASVLAGCVWITGMLMFAFSGDSVNASKIPDWLEPTVLLGWPCFLAASVVLPPLLFALGRTNRICLFTTIGCVLLSTVFYLVCWITLVSISMT